MRTENDIRAALRSLARQAPDADAVLTEVIDQLDKKNANHGGRTGFRRWMTPLAAAAAVIAVTASAVAIAHGNPKRAAGASSSLLDQLPRYYATVVIPSDARSTNGGPSIVVKNTLTGSTVVTVEPPAPYHTFAGITGAADDRTFVVAARPATAGITNNNQDIEKLFRARLNPAEHTLTMTPLPIPQFTPSTQLNGIALSPDGTELAVALATGRGHNQLVIRLYSLAGTLLRAWHSHGVLNFAYLNPANMSWSRTGVLAINWRSYTRSPSGAGLRSGVWLLDTTSPSGSLGAHTRLVVPGKLMSGFYPWGDGALSSDGQTIVVPMRHTVSAKSPNLPRIWEKIEEFSAATGRAIRSLWPVGSGADTIGNPGEVLMWSNAAGNVLVTTANLKSGPKAHGQVAVGVLSGKHLTPIPGTPRAKLYWYYGVVF